MTSIFYGSIAKKVEKKDLKPETGGNGWTNLQTNNQKTEKVMEQKTEFRNFGYSKKNFIDSQTLTYKTHQTSMRKTKMLSKTSKNNLTGSNKLWVGKTTPTTPTPPPTGPLLRTFTLLPVGPDGAAARRSSL